MYRSLISILALVLAACGGGADPDSSGPSTTDTTRQRDTTTLPTAAPTMSRLPSTTTTESPTTTSAAAPPTSTTPSSPTDTPPPPPRPGDDSETVTANGFWAVRVGETLADNESRIGGQLDDFGGDPTACLVLQLPEVGGLYFIAATPDGDPVADRGELVVARVSADQPGWRTKAGIEVGMAVSDAETLLGDTIVERRPHAYIDAGEYLVVGAPEERYVYESDGSTIVALHAGVEPVVSFVEACS